MSGALIEAAADEFQLQFGAYGLPRVQAGRSIGVLVADTAGDGFSGVSPAANRGGSAVIAALPRCPGGNLKDDVVMMVLEAVDSGGVVAFETPGAAAFDTADPVWEGRLAQGQRLGLYYFPDGGSDPAFPYGFYRSDEVTDGEGGGDHPYRIPGPGSAVVILTVSEEAGGAVSQEVFEDSSGVVGEGGVEYSVWSEGAFGPWVAEEQRAPLADPEGDGQTNAEEYAAGSDPLVGSPVPLDVARDDTGGWKLRYTSAGDRSDVLHSLEWSRDGRTWHRAEEGGSGDGPRFCMRVRQEEGMLTFEVEVDDGSAAGCWFRLRTQLRSEPLR